MGNGTDIGVAPTTGDGGVVDGDVRWVYDLVWKGEAVRPDGFICEEHPPKLTSEGIWERFLAAKRGNHIWEYRLPNLEINILIVFVLWQTFNILFKKMGLAVPKFTSMMLVSLSSSSSSSSSKFLCLLLTKSLLFIEGGASLECATYNKWI